MRNDASRSAVLLSGVTLMSLVALLIGAGRKRRCATDALRIGDRPRAARESNRGPSPVPPPDVQPKATSEDVLERYRLAAAV
jgi:hypothetical protein